MLKFGKTKEVGGRRSMSRQKVGSQRDLERRGSRALVHELTSNEKGWANEWEDNNIG